MQKVQMAIAGKQALVDADQVKKHVMKGLIVARSLELIEKRHVETDPICRNLLDDSLNDEMRKLKNLRIRKNVQFI